MMTDGKKIMCKRKEVIQECQKNDFTTETLFKNVFEKAYSLIVFRSQYEYNDIAHVGYDLPFKDMTGLYLLLAYEKYVLNKKSVWINTDEKDLLKIKVDESNYIYLHFQKTD